MILDKEVEITLNGSNINHFKLLGYENLKNKNKIIIPIYHLNKGSHYKINVRCDICEKINLVLYKDYIKLTKNNLYTCHKCAITKVRKTNLERHGDENYCNKEQIRKTIFEKYGVEHSMQNEKLFNKQQRNCFLSKKHDKTGLYYRGTYEKDFLDCCFNNNINIQKGKRIKYILYDKEHYYFSDFYYEPLNLIIEIKSKYTYIKNLEINILKQKSTIENGYNYLFIIDKKYEEFEKLIK